MLDLVAATADKRLRDFGDALREALSVQKLRQRDLGDRLGVTQVAVSDWINCQSEPSPETVFIMEHELRLAPGTLSRHLGYLPPKAATHVATVREAILGDSSLTGAEKEMLLGAYTAAVQGKRSRLRSMKKKS